MREAEGKDARQLFLLESVCACGMGEFILRMIILYMLGGSLRNIEGGNNCNDVYFT